MEENNITVDKAVQTTAKQESEWRICIQSLADTLYQLIVDVAADYLKVIINLMKEKIQSLGKVPGIIFDGFPRTVEQAEALDSELNIDLALNFDVADEVLVSRLTQRRSCPNPSCNAVYHLTNNPPKKEGVCDKCGSELYQRDDDKEETVKKRLDTYHKNTEPLIGYYEKAGKLVTICGIGDIDGIFSKVKEALQ